MFYPVREEGVKEFKEPQRGDAPDCSTPWGHRELSPPLKDECSAKAGRFCHGNQLPSLLTELVHVPFENGILASKCPGFLSAGWVIGRREIDIASASDHQVLPLVGRASRVVLPADALNAYAGKHCCHHCYYHYDDQDKLPALHKRDLL